MAENASHPELNNPSPGEQAYDPVERQIICRPSEGPVVVQSEAGQPITAWIVDLVPAFDPPQEPWWVFAVRDFTDPGETVRIMTLGKMPPDASLGFNVYTPGDGPEAKERLEKVIENIRILGNYQTDPASAIKMIIAPVKHAIEEAEEEEPEFTDEEAAEYVLNAVRNTPGMSERILGPAQPYQPTERVSYPRTTEPLS